MFHLIVQIFNWEASEHQINVIYITDFQQK